MTVDHQANISVKEPSLVIILTNQNGTTTVVQITHAKPEPVAKRALKRDLDGGIELFNTKRASPVRREDAEAFKSFKGRSVALVRREGFVGAKHQLEIRCIRFDNLGLKVRR